MKKEKKNVMEMKLMLERREAFEEIFKIKHV